jgi:hypothetical protein
MNKKKPKIHFYTQHPGEHPGDFYTNVRGLVTCPYCIRRLENERKKLRKIAESYK